MAGPEPKRLDPADINERIKTLLATPQDTFDPAYIKHVHAQLFRGQPGAGSFRSVNTEKDAGFISFRTTEWRKLDSQAAVLSDELKSQRNFSGMDREMFAYKLAWHIEGVNTLHPFRDGNMRMMAVYVPQLAKAGGMTLQFDPEKPAPWNNAAFIASATDDISTLRHVIRNISERTIVLAYDEAMRSGNRQRALNIDSRLDSSFETLDRTRGSLKLPENLPAQELLRNKQYRETAKILREELKTGQIPGAPTDERMEELKRHKDLSRER